MRRTLPKVIVQVSLVLLLFHLSVSVGMRGDGACPGPAGGVSLDLAPPSAFAWGAAQDLGDCACDCAKCEDVSPPTAEGPDESPINAGSGNLFLREVDYYGGAVTGLTYTRYHNSNSNGQFFTVIGSTVWNTEWNRRILYAGTVPPTPGESYAIARRADGRNFMFTAVDTAGNFATDTDVMERFRLVFDASHNVVAARFTMDDDTVELFKPPAPIPPRSTIYSDYFYIAKITKRNGLETNVTRPDDYHFQVTGPFGHTMTYEELIAGQGKMTTPDGKVYLYSGSYPNTLKVTYPDGKVRQYLYEATYPTTYGITGIIDELGNRFATFGYATMRATAAAQAGGAGKTTMTYNADGTTTVADARAVKHTYDFTTPITMKKPETVTGAPVEGPGGKAFTYDSKGLLASRKDWNGHVTTYTHDARGNRTSQTEAFGTALARKTTTAWHPSFHLPAKITEPNRSAAFAYDAHGNMLSKTITASGSTRKYSFTYDAHGQVLTATDPRGKITHFTYDVKGNQTSITNALGHKATYTNHDGSGRLLRSVDPNGVVTTLTYDARGRITSQTEGTLKTSYAYNAAGNLSKLTLPDGSWLTFTYDTAHRLRGIKDALGNRIAYTLDAASNVTRVQTFNPANVLTWSRSFAYNNVNRMTKTIGALGQTTIVTYDQQGNMTSLADPLAHKTTYTYDALNRLTKKTDPLGGETAYGYDANDNPVSIVDPRGLETVYAWNGYDDRTSITSPDSGTTKKTYDSAGNTLTSTNARGNKTTYVYDALNRRTKATFSDGKSVAWQYDQGAYGKGRLSKITDETGSTSYTYDANGNVTQKRQVVGTQTLTISYAYDSGGRLAGITYPSGKGIEYTYDAAGRVTRITKAGGPALISAVTYAPFGGVTGWSFGNGTIYRRSYDKDGRVAGLTMPNGYTVALSYDAASRIKQMKVASDIHTFSYDAVGHLTGFEGDGRTESYSYDANGNRTGATLADGTTTRHFDYSYPAASNRLSKITGTSSESFIYDAAGNNTTHTMPGVKHTFTYDGKNRLRKATAGTAARLYGINGLGQRVLKSDPNNAGNKTFFVYDETGHLLGEYGATGAAVEETVWLGDLPVANVRPGATYYIAPDHLGAPHQITNAAKQVVWRWDRNPFGDDAPTGGLAYNVRFPGQYYDAETRLHYNYVRDYNPKAGRYIQNDPLLWDGWRNVYAYVEGDPVSAADPYGLNPWWMKAVDIANQVGYTFGPGVLAAREEKALNQMKDSFEILQRLKKQRKVCKAKDRKALDKAIEMRSKQYTDAFNDWNRQQQAKDWLDKGSKVTLVGDPYGLSGEIIRQADPNKVLETGPKSVGDAAHGAVGRFFSNMVQPIRPPD